FYPWVDDESVAECANCEASNIAATSTLGCFAGGLSPYGVEELAGNVWEWTASPYDLAGAYQVLRGGAWPHDQRFLTTTFRYYALPGYRCDALGFRCIREE
ncbi:MAG: SUMF1/EgtB/PvdO family nonheme iron enzyme, partial [Caldilineaceae bacterium]|nr:SUMF1/EgtB/PvdO family nonheme iron enzyme [Caldilineaceae bacterium]